MPLHYTGLPPGTKLVVSTAPLAAPSAPTAAEHAPLSGGLTNSSHHVLGGDAGAGFTDIVVDVKLGPASYAVMEMRLEK